MLKSAKLIAVLCAVLFLQFLAVTPTHAQFPIIGQGGPKQNANDAVFQLRPGETIMADVVIRKNFIGEKVTVNFSLSPLTVSQFINQDPTAAQDPANHRITLLVTAPTNIQVKNYRLNLSANNGRTTTRTELSFDVTNNAPFGSTITNATLIPFPESLFINGSGFNPGRGNTVRVFLNDADITDAITSINDGFISIETSGNRFQYRKGGNEVIVVTNGHISNRFILQQ